MSNLAAELRAQARTRHRARALIVEMRGVPIVAVEELVEWRGADRIERLEANLRRLLTVIHNGPAHAVLSQAEIAYKALETSDGE